MLITFDFEVQSHNKGNPFDSRNYPICFAYKQGTSPAKVIWCDEQEYFKDEVKNVIDKATHLIGFNAKFDLHWLAWLGIRLRDDQKVIDGQVAEFLINNQKTPYPSLDGCSQKYLGETKIDVVKTKYWDKDRLTSEVPKDLLCEYAAKDVELTYAVVKKQIEILRETGKVKLFQLHMEDLKVLQEMEFNGLRFDEFQAHNLSVSTKQKIEELDNELFGSHPYREYINPNSGDHLSVYLYGGTIIQTERIPNGTYKTGAKAGQVRYKLVDYELKFERLFEPVDGSELKKQGYYSTDEKVLRKLKGNKRLINNLLLRSELDKLVSTYYEGLIKIRNKMNWVKDHLHGQLNMVVTRTGRLSASEPNQQNMSGNIKELFYSRYC